MLLHNFHYSYAYPDQLQHQSTFLQFVHLNQSTDKTVKMFIDAGADLDLQDIWGSTALMLAILSSNEETAKILIDAGANINIQNLKGETALGIAARKSMGTNGVFEKLLTLTSKQLVPILRKISGSHNVDRFVLRMIALEWKFGSSDPQVIREKFNIKN